MTLETNFYHFGLGAGLPFRALHSVANVVSGGVHAADLMTRRRLAARVTKNSQRRGFVSRTHGWAPLAPDTLPGTERVLDIVRALIEERRDYPERLKPRNPFDYLERPEDFQAHPELLAFALSDDLLEIACDYYGVLPQLKEIGFWLSKPVDHLFSSQYYHLDKPESRIFSLFLNVEDNPPDVGLTTFLPADVSRRVRRQTRYDKVYFRGNGRLTDEQVYASCAQSDAIEIDGRRGHGAIVDTTSCFHYGSRCSTGQRAVFSIKFMLAHKARNPRTPSLDGHAYGDDPIRRLVLAGAKPG